MRFDLAEHALELGVGAHERIDMLDSGHALILRDHRAGDGDERFARRIRDEMEMKIAASHDRSLCVQGVDQCG